ncbi:MAG: YcgN family cysteine cluster protein [Beijerinckiaceae bacterium]
MTTSDIPFWKTKSLEEMNPQEWESLCDGCGRCCLVKLEDADDGTLYYTDVSCRLFDAGSCRCKDYVNRSSQVPDCVTLTPQEVRTLPWLPPTCGYRRLAEGKNLDWWHPLVSGDPETVVKAGISVRGCVSASEDDVSVARMQKRIRLWPNSEKPSEPVKTRRKSV